MGIFDNLHINWRSGWEEAARESVAADEVRGEPDVALDVSDAIRKILTDRNVKQVYESVLAQIAVNWIGHAAGQTIPRLPHSDAQRLLMRPHPEYSYAHWVHRMVFDMYAHGQSFSQMHLDGDGRPEMLEPLDPRKIELPSVIDGIHQFEYTPSEGPQQYIPVDEMLNFRWRLAKDNPYEGAGPFDDMGTTLYVDERAMEYTGTVLKNALTGWLVGMDNGMKSDSPGIVMTNREQQKAVDKLNSALADDKAGLMQIIPFLISLVRLEPIFTDLDFTRFHYEAETRVCGVTGLQPSVLAFGVSSETTRVGAVAYEQRRESWRQGVIPALKKIEDELTWRLLRRFVDNVYTGEDSVDSVVKLSTHKINEMRPSPLEAEQLFNGVEKRTFTPNEVRDEYGYDEIPGGDEFYEPKPAALSVGFGEEVTVNREK